MMSELISARLGTAQPEDNPALAGSTPPKAGSRRPLQDQDGQPLLPRMARAIQAVEALPKPAAVAPVEEPAMRPAEPDAAIDPLDPAWVASAFQRGWEIRGEQLGRLARRIAVPVWSTLQVWAERSRARRDLRAVMELYSATGAPMPWADLGGSRSEMLAEAGKPFWRS